MIDSIKPQLSRLKPMKLKKSDPLNRGTVSIRTGRQQLPEQCNGNN